MQAKHRRKSCNAPLKSRLPLWMNHHSCYSKHNYRYRLSCAAALSRNCVDGFVRMNNLYKGFVEVVEICRRWSRSCRDDRYQEVLPAIMRERGECESRQCITESTVTREKWNRRGIDNYHRRPCSCIWRAGETL